MRDALRDDTDVHSLELAGNNFDLKVRILRIGQPLVQVSYPGETEITHWRELEQVIDINLDNEREFVQRLSDPRQRA